jgi:hypothetical protein
MTACFRANCVSFVSFFYVTVLRMRYYTSHTIVPHAIDVLKNAGYRLVTVAECFGVAAYQ